MREFARVCDAAVDKTATVTSETSFLAQVLDGQRRIVASALDHERNGKFNRDLEAERQMLGTLEDKTPEDQALRDIFVGQAETANLKLEAELNAVRKRMVDLFRQQASNWIRNGRFIEAIAPLRELSRHTPLMLQDKLILVRALRPLSKEPTDEAGREIATLHAETKSQPDTTDWIDWQVSIGQSAVTQMRLGNYWSHRRSGSKDEALSNLKQAFRHYEAARIIWERQDCAGELGAIEYTLADWEMKRALLCERSGERENHLKETVRLCESAIRKLSPAVPGEWKLSTLAR